jgi:hypothetical protein
VTGEGPHTGQQWKIARDEKLLLNAKGGEVARAAEVRMAKLVAEEETVEMQLGIAMERTARMVLGAASKFNILQMPDGV